ncbi:amino acid adenylation domain-containing protein [Paenibacillus sp. SC116]|uniref:non-ribosomal peptide synthetase n=1 Tax=Paenibacillus sp. SC116 TaxID=2968986 RepID=UPI00215AB695|nr:non-ribosomal peptide synthetase [Paenibacillus sp. SC116]MCR8843803.1 amino acid adenylation domain-containing protein [Paenibacillus sp. SC116]
MGIRRLTDMLRAASQHEDIGVTFIQSSQKESFLSYKLLYEAAQRLAGYFQNKGLVPGDEVLFQIEDEELFIKMFWACVLGGFIPVPVSVGNNDEHKRKLFQIWKVLDRPVLLITENNRSYVEAFAQRSDFQEQWTDMQKRTFFADSLNPDLCPIGIIHEPNASDPAFIQFSSGSTGDPKGVILTHDNLLTNLNAMINGAGIGTKDSILSWMPLTHDMGLIGCHMVPIAVQVQQYIMPTSLFVRRPALWMLKCSEHRATVLSSPNFGYQYFMGKFKPDTAASWDLSHVRLIFNGAEPISAQLATKFMGTLAPYGLQPHAMFPVYGMAEACLAVTFPPLGEEVRQIHLSRSHLSLGNRVEETDEDNGITFVDVGSPVDDCFLQIADESGNELGELMIGEIFIKGRNVTSGYYNNESATTERITKSGWLRTGDLGFMRNGRLYVTGRAKDILFVNGQNVYPHDIERICENVEPIKLGTIAACGVSNPETKSDDVLLFVAHHGKIDAFAPLALTLHSHVQQQLGIAVKHVIPVAKLPKTTSGKIQRYKLSEWYDQQIFADEVKQLSEFMDRYRQERQLELPTTETEERLLELCCNLLGVEAISIGDSLFDWGGNSLQLTYLIAAVRAEFGVKLALHDVFHKPTIRQLAHLIDNAQTIEREEFIVTPTTGGATMFPATNSQRGIYAWQQLNTDGVSYNIVTVLKLEGKVSLATVQNAWQMLVARHVTFQTYFAFHDGELMQQIASNFDAASSVAYEEVIGLTDIQGYTESFVQPHDLHKAPPWRVKLCKISEQQYVFLADIHHSVMDGTSMHIVMGEFAQIVSSQNHNLKQTSISFTDYSTWRHKQPIDEAQQIYWLTELSGELPVLEMPTYYPRPALLSDVGDRYYMKVDKELAERCRQFARDQHASVYMVLLAAYKLMLAQCAGQQDLIVGTSSAGRNVSGTEHTAGMFVQTLAIRSQPEGHKTISEYVREMKEKTLLALEYQDYPIDQLIEQLDIKRDASRNPLFDTMFVYQNMAKATWNEGELRIERVPYAAKTSKFDFSLIVEEMDDALVLEWEYRSALYERDMIAEMGAYYCNLLGQICGNPERLLSELSVLNVSQREELMQLGIGPACHYPKDNLMHWLFEDQAAITPDHIAVEFGQKMATYRELDEQANRLARVLIAHGLKQDMLVAILLPPCIEQIVSILAVMKAGGAYLPIDIEYPTERIAYLLEDSQSPILITDGHRSNQLDYTGTVVNVLDPSLGHDYNVEPVIRTGSPRQLAYIIYTSGSTGKPKGVMVEQQGLVNYIWWAKKVYTQHRQVNFPLYSSISFDLTVTSIFTPLITGGKIVIYGEDDKDLAIQHVFAHNKVQIVKLTPSHLKIIKDWDNRNSSVTTLIVGGEQLDTQLAMDVLNSFGGRVSIYNEYGPTETVVGCMIYHYNSQDQRAVVPIGQAADNVQIYLLDSDRRLVPKYSVGEIYIAGDGVARGYYGRPALTEERFVKDFFSEHVDAAMYRTGDLARWLPDGSLEYIGRADNQVKIRGYRIELQEVQHVIAQLDEIKEVVVLAHRDHAEQAYLCAYVVASQPISLSNIRKELSVTLPLYMMPSYFIQVDQIPLTPNGKVNPDALPKPKEQVRTHVVEGNPRNKTEEICVRVWSDILELDQVGVHDEFYELGGDSIKAIQISSQLKQLGIPVETKQILQHQTIFLVCEHLDMNAAENNYEQGLVSGEKGMFPIDHWFFEQKLSQIGHYHQSVLLKMRQPIELERLRMAFERLIIHHDGLRLNVKENSNSLFFEQEHASALFSLHRYMLEGHLEEQNMIEIETAAARMKSEVDITKDLLFQASVFTSRDQTDYVFITAHHLVIDGVSWRILLEDLKLAYEQLSLSLPVQMPAKTASLTNWYEGVLQYAGQASVMQQADYWRSNLQAASGSLLQAAEVDDWSSAHRRCHVGWLDADNTHALLTQAHRAYKTDPVDLMLTALARTMHLLDGSSVIGIELEKHGRHLDGIDVSRTVGWFTALFPIRLELPQAPLSKQIQAVKEQLRQVPDKGLSYGVLAYMNKVLPMQDQEPAPFRFNYLGQFGKEANNDWFELVYRENMTEIHPENRMNAKLELNSLVMQGRLRLELMYHNEAFGQDVIRQWMDLYVQQLQAMIAHVVNEQQEQFTPSDFDTVDVTQQQLDMLFK